MLPSVLKFGLHVHSVVSSEETSYPAIAGKGKQRLSVASERQGFDSLTSRSGLYQGTTSSRAVMALLGRRL
jgi:hypothetical protein